jgi:hypothetical protein
MKIDKEYAIKKMIGKKAYSVDDELIGKIQNIIDQPDNQMDNIKIIGDITGDLFQILVTLDTESFQTLKKDIQVLFSSQTIKEVRDRKVVFNLSSQTVNDYLE